MLLPPDSVKRGFIVEFLSWGDVIREEQKMLRSIFKEKVTDTCKCLGKGIWGGDREEMGGVRGRRDQRTHIKDRGAGKVIRG